MILIADSSALVAHNRWELFTWYEPEAIIHCQLDTLYEDVNFSLSE